MARLPGLLRFSLARVLSTRAERRVYSLSAQELLTLAGRELSLLGRTAMAARLLYRALQLDPTNIVALSSASEFFGIARSTELADPLGSFSVAFIEYAGTQSRKASEGERRRLDFLRARLMCRLGLVKNASGQLVLNLDENEWPRALEIDEASYVALMGRCAGRLGSIQSAVHVGHTLLGVLGGVLTGKRVTDASDRYFPWVHPAKCWPTREWYDWLLLPVSRVQRSPSSQR